MEKSWMMAVALVLGACGGSEKPQAAKAAAPSTTERSGGCDDGDGCAQSLLAADQALQDDVAARGIAAAFLDALDDDATFLVSRQYILTGKPAIATYLQTKYPAPASATLTWIVARPDVSAHGDLGYTFGWTILTVAGAAPRTGDYLAIWRRHGGQWILESWLLQSGAPRTPPPSWWGPVSPSFDSEGVNEEKALVELEQVDSQFAALSVAQGQQVANDANAAPDAVEILRDMTFGAAAIHASHCCDQGTVLAWAPSAGGVARSGDLGYTIGNFVFTIELTPPLHFYGKYLTLWKRQPDGQWKYEVGGSNLNPGP